MDSDMDRTLLTPNDISLAAIAELRRLAVEINRYNERCYDLKPQSHRVIDVGGRIFVEIGDTRFETVRTYDPMRGQRLVMRLETETAAAITLQDGGKMPTGKLPQDETKNAAGIVIEPPSEVVATVRPQAGDGTVIVAVVDVVPDVTPVVETTTPVVEGAAITP